MNRHDGHGLFEIIASIHSCTQTKNLKKKKKLPIAMQVAKNVQTTMIEKKTRLLVYQGKGLNVPTAFKVYGAATT